jgi:hypothetical protein
LEQQQQQQGRLPQRGSVSTLFGSSGPEPNPLEREEVEDKDSTITAHARKNVHGNEPRLLPFPQTAPSQLFNSSFFFWTGFFFDLFSLFFFKAGTSNSIATHHHAHVTPSHIG